MKKYTGIWVDHKKAVIVTKKQQERSYEEDADKILIMGPGEAKLELKKEIEKSKALIPKIVGVHTSDKMTNNQIAAKVKSYFGQK
jgi:hypothetical protein